MVDHLSKNRCGCAYSVLQEPARSGNPELWWCGYPPHDQNL